MSEGHGRLTASLALFRGSFRLDCHLDLPACGVTAIFGPSGCGKSSLLRCLAGLERGCAGVLHFAGQTWQDDGLGQFVVPQLRRVGMIFQGLRLFPHLTVEGNLAYGFRRTPAGLRGVNWAETVKMCGITPFLQRKPADLSGGQRQRVAIARALLASPALLLMDEPVASLDAGGKGEILSFIRQLHERLGIPILYVSHDLGEIVKVADRLLLMEDGRITAHGPLAELLSRLDFPLAHAPDAAALVEARVVGLDERFHLARLSFAGGALWVVGEGLSAGDVVRVRIMARDVSLTLDPPGRTSILNVLPAEVIDLKEESPQKVMVRLGVGETVLLSRVTARSREMLALAAGVRLFAQVKSVALENGWSPAGERRP